MNTYESIACDEMQQWQKKMERNPGFVDRLAKRVQHKVNSYIPEKVHRAITGAIKQMVRGVLFGAKITTTKPALFFDLETAEIALRKKIDIYRKTAAVEGGITGAGGILLGLADFPLLLAIKIKLLFEIASAYGMDLNDYKERIYMLQIFELAFSSDQHRRQVYFKMVDWEEKKKDLPENLQEFDWRTFQQEYRDYLDLAKLAQLLPVIGAPVGVVVNNRLIRKLGKTAMNAYRMRLFNEKQRDQ